jgi:predicted DNA binding CopG/RHH family protein
LRQSDAGGYGVVDRKENQTVRIPKFKTEKQEADWLHAHRREIEAEMSKEKRLKTPPLAQIVERERTKPISIRLAVGDIERAKQQAKAKGIGYQTLIRMLVHDGLSSVRRIA